MISLKKQGPNHRRPCRTREEGDTYFYCNRKLLDGFRQESDGIALSLCENHPVYNARNVL